ncbi:MAG TPA: AMP-binding protein, partial [Solirubrobacteraceae bacterium]|nr:AMP-binding protein [Solirubrobacteraceae bacterium]
MSEPLFPRLYDAGEREAIHIAGQAMSYAELAGASAALAARLGGAGRVAVWAEPTLELCVAVLGALAAGVSIVPINPGLGARELGHIVEDSAPEKLLARTGVQAPPQLSALERIDVDPTERSSAIPAGAPGDEDVAFVMYTSGTTGPPKGVQIPRRAIASNLDALAEIWQWTAEDRVAHALPVFHVHGLILGMLGPLRRGGSFEHVGRFSPDALAGALDRGATMVFGVPTMYGRIAREAAEDRALAEAFAGARLLVSGSAALPTTVHDGIERLT